MKAIGYLVLINNAFPDTIAFNKEDSIDIAKRFNPKALKYITRTYTERRSASELARMLAFDNSESREEILDRVRRELETHWVGMRAS
ncbi:MAG: hypothetical protein DRG24_00530 [Epsilonproteobacteria bacterium]|nr:MAG: hypothetical protein DRG24_00530 [Campylobacterota bacterium]